MKKSKDKVCLEDSQVKRLAHDAFMMGKGEHEGICETVNEIVHESTTKEERIGKLKGKKKKKEHGDNVLDKFVTGRIKKKISEAFDGFF